MRFILSYVLIAFSLFIQVVPAYAEDIYRISEDKSKAVFFINHHIGEDQYPNSNLKVEQFEAHIKELKSDEYKVLSVINIVESLKAGEKLPHHTVGITLDGGYRSTLENAIPLLLKAKLPFTLFIAPERIDRGSDYYMNWGEIRKLAKNNLVSIGALPFSYSHIIDLSKDEQQKSWGRSLARFKEELKLTPLVFSWPYGEYTQDTKDIIKEYPFIAGFAQHSGVVFGGSDIFALPRFSMTEEYGDIDRFRLAAHSYPLPITDIKPMDMILDKKDKMISFSLPTPLKNQESLACFISGIGKVELLHSKKIENSIKLDYSVLDKRIRMNCTLPVLSADESNQLNKRYWRWYGRLFIAKNNFDDANSRDFSLSSPIEYRQ